VVVVFVVDAVEPKNHYAYYNLKMKTNATQFSSK
jgi:hypothetical protein